MSVECPAVVAGARGDTGATIPGMVGITGTRMGVAGPEGGAGRNTAATAAPVTITNRLANSNCTGRATRYRTTPSTQRAT